MSTADQLAQPGKDALPLGYGADNGFGASTTGDKYADTLKPAPPPDEEDPANQGYNRQVRNPATGELASPPQVEGETTEYEPELGDDTFTNGGEINRPTETEAEQRMDQDTLSSQEIEQLAKVLHKIVPDQATTITEILNTEIITREYAISMLQAMAKTAAGRERYPRTHINLGKLNSPDTAKLKAFGVDRLKDALTHPDTEIFIELGGDEPHITITTPDQNQRPAIKLELTGFINLVSPNWQQTQELNQIKTLDPDNPADKLMAYYLFAKLNLSNGPSNLDPENIYISQQQPKETQTTKPKDNNTASLSTPTGTEANPPTFTAKKGTSPSPTQPDSQINFDPLTDNQLPTSDKNGTPPNQTAENAPTPETNTSIPDSFYTPPEWPEQQRQTYWNSLTKDQKEQYPATAQALLKTLNADTVPAWYEHNPEAKNDQNEPVPKYKQWEQFLTRATRNNSVAENLFKAYLVNKDKVQPPQIFQKNWERQSSLAMQQAWETLNSEIRNTWWKKQKDQLTLQPQL